MLPLPDIFKPGLLDGAISRRTALTVSTGAVLTGLYGVYALLISSRLAPPSLPDGPTSAALAGEMRIGPVINSQMAERYLPSQPWAANAAIQLRTDEAFVYAQDWEPADSDKAVRFEKFAVIWMQKGRREDEAPITIVSDSAFVRFASPFNLTDPDPGRIVSGALQGRVRIEGPNGLEVTGQNFEFQEEAMRIWCDRTVTFRYGPHRGTALGLQIELIPDDRAQQDGNGPKDGGLAVAGIQSIRLRRNVWMRLVSGSSLPGSNPFRRKREANASSDIGDRSRPPNEPTGEQRIVTVRSAGSFDYVVATHMATFEENVEVVGLRTDKPNELDTLQCDRLTLVFEPPSSDQDGSTRSDSKSSAPLSGGSVDESPDGGTMAGKPDDSSEERFQGLQANLQFRRLRAEGGNVLLNSEGNRLTARMNELIYDDQTNVAKLTAASGQQVDVVQDTSELSAPEIQLVQDGEGDVTSAWCKGAGRLTHHDPQTGALELAAQWSKQLRKYPADTDGTDVIEFEQDVVIRQPEQSMGLAAEFLRVWIERDSDAETRSAQTAKPADDAESGVSRLPAPSKRGAGGEGRGRNGLVTGSSGRFRPQRMLALKDVALISPQMNAVTQRLEVWFEDGRLPQSRQSDNQTIGQSDNPRVPHPHVPSSPNHIEQGGRADEGMRSEGDAERFVPSEEPIQLQADLIRVRIVQDAESRQAEPAEVWTFGNVQVQQKHDANEPPLRLTGDRLHIENRGGTDQVLHVFGKPAHIRDRGLRLEGADIRFDRQRNLVRVDGSGLLELPVNRTLEGDKLDEPALLDVWWQEQMTFDGLTAHFLGDVRSVLADHHIRCQDMQVELTERLSFRGSASERTGLSSSGTPNHPEQQADVKDVLCRGRVEFESSSYEGRKLTAVRQGQFAEFSLNQRTGKTTARGPGWIVSWRRGRGKRAALSPTATVQANRSLQPDTTEWEYTRIDFAGRTDGNIKQQFTTFEDRVKIVYGPVEQPLDVVNPDDPDGLPKDAGWMRCDSLELTQHQETESLPAYLELFAEGNVKLEGRTFFARADMISYDESKGLYTLRSLAPRKATIWRQTKVGGESSSIPAQSMQFIPSKNILKLDRSPGLEGVE